jgi:hypothetical protein
MQFLVFDIETAALDFEMLSESQQEYWLRGITTEEEKEKKLFEMGLTPFTSQVSCIGVMLTEIIDGEVKIIKKAAISSSYDINNENDYRTEELTDGSTWYLKDEKGLLKQFWDIFEKKRDVTLVSFNGRIFDAPYLMLRSAIHSIKPTRNLMSGTKFNYDRHIDLIDELTFYSPSNGGATKKFNFDFYTRSFGITSPKSEGVDGKMVGDLWKNGEHKQIAEYCLRDVSATWELFLHWDKYLNFKKK